MLASERRVYIMKNLYQKGIINIKDIARELNISEITVRRDFEKMELEGKLKRVQGGAALEEALENAELTMQNRLSVHVPKKRLVSEAAADLVQDGDHVFVDAGTTMAPLLDILLLKPVKIVTYNSLIVRNMPNPVAEMFVVGGKYLPHYSMFVGASAQDMLKQFRFNIAFLGCSGVDVEEGVVYTTEMESLLMKKIALERAEKQYLLLDDSKLEKHGFLKFTDLSGFTGIICNRIDNKPYIEKVMWV
ncbi:DeoR/GlpR family DNA-binding transcription regulator [Propionispora vibrioides]|uniref:Lactose phosphotransferase system repressor n=1 Tax=Propionispora vibrioides TaxID=112903 RepID=A0A1H8T842_9FIRM|nr:DeoR/GlpR family DNA-binding transcription regulator [Propionispora vibrioides]SEO86704.1 transcriptional regulator, DeoR family [Propionispora vibrioides]